MKLARKYVLHPRYGDKPHITGLDPDPNAEGVFLHWNTGLISDSVRNDLKTKYGFEFNDESSSHVIRGTAVIADLSKQSRATVAVTHYYDLEKVCRDCGNYFIFFAKEQKHWYEEIGLPLEADAVRCFPCRKKDREIESLRRRYEELFHLKDKTADQEAELADCRLSLIEEGIFNPRQLEGVRAYLNRYPEHQHSAEIKARIEKFTKTKDQ